MTKNQNALRASSLRFQRRRRDQHFDKDHMVPGSSAPSIALTFKTLSALSQCVTAEESACARSHANTKQAAHAAPARWTSTTTLANAPASQAPMESTSANHITNENEPDHVAGAESALFTSPSPAGGSRWSRPSMARERRQRSLTDPHRRPAQSCRTALCLFDHRPARHCRARVGHRLHAQARPQRRRLR